MQLHLLLPGLLWPAKVLYDCAHDLELPALARLLGRGRMARTQPIALEDWLCGAWAIGSGEAPVAPLRLLGEGYDPGRSVWLCADPGQLSFEQGRLILGSRAADIDEAEMRALLRAIEPRVSQLPGYLQLRAGAPGSGYAYLALAAKPEMSALPPSAARGVGGELDLPRGPQGPAWTRLGNELQMLLHAMDENKQREAAGRPLVNTLWFWGAGELPPVRPSPYTTLLGADPLLKGLAAWSAAAIAPLPASGAELPREGSSLACIDDLAAATQALDAGLWREVLLDLERRWFVPIAAAHAAGRIRSLRLTALGPEATLDVHLGRGDRWRFWRRPRSLASLAAEVAGDD